MIRIGDSHGGLHNWIACHFYLIMRNHKANEERSESHLPRESYLGVQDLWEREIMCNTDLNEQGRQRVCSR